METFLDNYVISDKDRKIAFELLHLFNLNGRPVDEIATEGELKIFHAIVFRPSMRVQIIASTQYGKSLFVALGCLVVSCIQEEVVSVVAPTDEKAKIIMRYYVDHLGDDPVFYDKLEKDTKLDRLRQEESKERIILRNKGGIFVVSAQAANTRRTLEAAMGLGSKIVIQDESCLIPDQTEATIFRMIAGKGAYAFYCKIGNPFYRVDPYLHFWESWNNPDYAKIFIDYHQGLAEGRYTEEFINEARNKPLFDILFECKFPSPDAMVEGGWLPLLTPADVERAYVDADEPFGTKRLGADVAGGGRNYSAMVLRSYNMARKVYKSQEPDTMLFTGNVLHYSDNLGVKDRDIFVDALGIGRGLADRLREQRKDIVAVIGSEEPLDKQKFINKRAEMFWRLREWILKGGKLERDSDWVQLTKLKYKVADSSGKIKIMSKEEMLKDGIDSPDIADSLALTFARPDETLADQQQQSSRVEVPRTDPYDSV